MTGIYKYWIHFLIKKHFLLKIYFRWARTLQLIPLLFGCRFFSQDICFIAALFQEILAFIKHLEMNVQNIKHWKKGNELILRHKCLEIILATGNNEISNLAFFRIGMVAVLANFISLKMYQIIPMPFYLFFPPGAMLLSSLIAIILPMVTNVYENVVEVIAEWKYYYYFLLLSWKQ